MVPLDFANYGPLILATLLGFFSLAALLLVPIYRFLKREEAISTRWTSEQLRRHADDADIKRDPEA
jgi:hypothetical protein